ncbi:MAG: hypothetical protein ACE5KH_04970 [Candidatus Geothermarchaeales archaeon]
MTPKRLFRLARWSGYFGAAAALVLLAYLVYSEVVRHVFSIYPKAGPVMRFIPGVIIPSSMVPIAVALRRLYGEDRPIVSALVTVTGIVGMLGLAALWTIWTYELLIFEPISPGFSVRFYSPPIPLPPWFRRWVDSVFGVAVSLWLVLSGYLIFAHGARRGLPRSLALLGVVAGLGMILWLGTSRLAVPSKLITGYPLSTFILSGGVLAMLTAYPIWAIWLGRRLLAGSSTAS